MSTPVIENIAVNIAAAINAITTVNGFNQTLIAIRPRRLDFSDISPDDLTVLVVQADEEDVEEQAIGTSGWMQPFAIMAIVLDSDSATDSIDTRINQVASDIRKKLMESPGRGGYADDTILFKSARFDDGKGFTGINVPVAVKYRTELDDPYTKA